MSTTFNTVQYESHRLCAGLMVCRVYGLEEVGGLEGIGFIDEGNGDGDLSSLLSCYIMLT